MKFKLFIIPLLTLSVANCTLEPIPKPEKEGEKIVTISVNIPAETRVAYNGETGNNALTWETGDQILLAGYDGATFKGSQVFNYSGTGNKFTGTPVVDATTYKAYYPGNIITLDGNGNMNPLAADFWQQSQDGDGTRGHLKNKLLLFDEIPNPINQTFSLTLKSSILKLDISGIPQQVGELDQLIYTVETATGVFKPV